jgi:dihydroorotate dehydrogenase
MRERGNMLNAAGTLLSRLPPETAHGLAIRGLELFGAPAAPAPAPGLHTTVAGLSFPTPIGLAAGFDKDARVWRQMLGCGFGFVEVGTLTPKPQGGNPRPRIFRLREDGAVINRLGFNNGGLNAALPRLAPHPLLGVNVGANKDSADRIADYALGVAAVRDRAAWITLNISSPNTPGLRGLQGDALPELLAAAGEARGGAGPPLFLKVAPDLDGPQMDFIARAVSDGPVAAIVVSNTTLARPEGLRSRHAAEAGGLSGLPLMGPSTEVLRGFARRLGGTKPLIGVGGVRTAADVLCKLKAGASAVQLYTALVYEGVDLPARLARDLSALLRREGFGSPAEAVGLDL